LLLVAWYLRHVWKKERRIRRREHDNEDAIYRRAIVNRKNIILRLLLRVYEHRLPVDAYLNLDVALSCFTSIRFSTLCSDTFRVISELYTLHIAHIIHLILNEINNTVMS
jgi:hypothetical protein